MKTRIQYYSAIDSSEKGLLFYAVHPDGRCLFVWTEAITQWLPTNEPAYDAIPCSYSQIRKLGIARPAW